MVSSHTLKPTEVDDCSDSFQPFPTRGPVTWLTSFISCRAEILLLILHVVTSQWLSPNLMMIQEKSHYDLEKNADPNYSFMYSFINLFNQSLLSISTCQALCKILGTVPVRLRQTWPLILPLARNGNHHQHSAKQLCLQNRRLWGQKEEYRKPQMGYILFLDVRSRNNRDKGMQDNALPQPHSTPSVKEIWESVLGP